MWSSQSKTAFKDVTCFFTAQVDQSLDLLLEIKFILERRANQPKAKLVEFSSSRNIACTQNCFPQMTISSLMFQTLFRSQGRHFLHPNFSIACGSFSDTVSRTVTVAWPLLEHETH